MSWGFSTDPTCGEVETFSVFRDGRRLTIDESDQTLTDTDGILPKTRYCYEVEATTRDGVFPAETCVTTPPPPVPPRPDPPGHFETGTITSSSIELLWDEVAGATHYKIDYGTDSNALTTSLDATGTSHTVTLLSPGTQYHFEARTVNSAGQSEAVKTSGTTSCVRPAPTRLEAEGVTSSDAIDLEWRAPSNTGGCAITYQIDRRKGTSGSYTTIESSWSGTEYRDSNVECGETYSYKVYTVANGTPGTAFDEADAAVRACPNPCTRPAPPGFTATPRTSSDGSTWIGAPRRIRDVARSPIGSTPEGDLRRLYDHPVELAEHGLHALGPGLRGALLLPRVYGRRRDAGTASGQRHGPRLRCVDPPAVPGTPTVSVSGNDVTISWGSVSIPEGCTSVNYRLSRNGTRRQTTSSTFYTDRNLSPGTYDYRVLAASHPGDHPSNESGARRATIDPAPPMSCQAPATPGSFSTSLSGDTVTVSWDAVPVPAHCTWVEYFVWQGSTKIETTSVTSYADRGLPAGEHCYQVSAASGPNGGESQRTGTRCETVLPPPPTRFMAIAASSSSVDLSWRAASGADSYELRYWDTDEAEPNTWDDLGNVTAYTVTGLEAETEYEFKLQTVDGTLRSETVSVSETTTDPGGLAPPGDFSAAGLTETSIRLSWNRVSEAASYELRYAEDGEPLPQVWEDVGDVGEHTVMGLMMGTEYVFELRSVSGANRSPAVSASAEAGAPLVPPARLEIEAVSRTELLATWDAVAGADSYLVVLTGGVVTSGQPEDLRWEFSGLMAATEYCVTVFVVRGPFTSEESSPECAATWGGPPENLRVRGMSEHWVDLEWDEAPGATRYRVYQGEAGSSAPGTEFRAGSLTGGETYGFRVAQAYDGTESEKSEELRATTPALLPPPGQPVAVADDAGVALSWAAGSGGGVWSGPGGSGEQELGYAVERRTPPETGTWGEVASDLRAREYLDASAAPGADYEYRVLTTVSIPGDVLKSSPGMPVMVMSAGPVMPANVMAAAQSSVAMRVSWNAVAGADGYEVQWRLDREDWSASVDVGSATEYVDDELLPATEYWYQVRTRVGLIGTGVFSGWSEAPPAATEALAVPANLMAMETSATSVRLSWEAVEEADRYNVERMRMSDGVPVELKLPDAETDFEDERLLSEQEYMYRVQAVLVHDGEEYESEWSEAVAVTPMLSAPELMVAVVSSVRLDVSWTAVSAATGYELAWSTDGTDWDLLYSGADLGEEHTDLIPGTEYWYRAQSVRVEGGETARSGWSDPPTPAATEALAVPGNLMAMETSATSVRLSWEAVEEADRYNVERIGMSDGIPTEFRLPDAETSYEDDRLLSEQEYTYRVQAVLVHDGEEYKSEWSEAAVVTPMLAAPELMVAVVSSVRLDVSWTAVSAATGYELAWSTDGTDWDALYSGTDLGDEHPDLIPGTEYWYRAQSVRVEGGETARSGWSDPPTTERTEALAVPANLMAMETSATSVRLSWEAVEEADRYNVERIGMSDGIPTEFRLPDAETSYEDDRLLSEQEYTYRVQAVLVHDGEEYQSEWSEAVAVTPMLAAPELMVAVVSSVRLDVSWTAVSAATGYELAWSTDGEDWDLLYSGADLGEEHTDLIPGTEYWYRVQSVRVEGGETARSGWSDPPATERTEALAVPANLMAMETSATSVRLSWEAVEEADRYNVERVQMSDGEIAEFKLPDAGASWEDDRLLSEQEYTYRVQAVLVHDGEEYESEWSEAVAVTPMLAAPELMVAVVSSVRLDVSWTAVSAATGYELEWSTDGEDWDALYSGTDLGYEDAPLIPGTEYWYRVQSVRVEGGETARSGWSDPPTTERTEALAVPANLMAMGMSATSIGLSWDRVEEADRYDLERTRMAMDAPPEVVQVPGAGTSYEDPDLRTDEEYTYRVRAVVVRSGVDYWSEWSNAAPARPGPVDPALEIPEGLMATATSPFAVAVTWEAVTGAEGYDVRRQDGAVTSVPGARHADTDLAPGTAYAYEVRSVRGSDSSAWTAPEPVTTDAFTAPENFTATVTSASEVALSWDPSPGTALEYRVRWRVRGEGWAPAQRLAETAYAVTGLLANTEYQFRVVAYRRAADGDWHRTGAADTEAQTLAQ